MEKKQTTTTKHDVRNDLIQDFFDEVKVRQQGNERRLPSWFETTEQN